MIDLEELLRELNEVLAKHEARLYVMGYEFDVWFNHKDDDWTHETLRPYIHGKFEDLS
jgi:hypothetical protein